MTDEDEDIPEPPPFELWYPFGYAYETWLDHKTHGNYPRPGGYNAQCPRLMADWRMFRMRYNYHARNLLRQRGTKGRDPLDLLMEDAGAGGSFEDMFTE